MLTREVHIVVPGWVAALGMLSIALFWWCAFWFLYGFVRGVTRGWRRQRALRRFLDDEGVRDTDVFRATAGKQPPFGTEDRPDDFCGFG